MSVILSSTSNSNSLVGSTIASPSAALSQTSPTNPLPQQNRPWRSMLSAISTRLHSPSSSSSSSGPISASSISSLFLSPQKMTISNQSLTQSENQQRSRSHAHIHFNFEPNSHHASYPPSAFPETNSNPLILQNHGSGDPMLLNDHNAAFAVASSTKSSLSINTELDVPSHHFNILTNNSNNISKSTKGTSLINGLYDQENYDQHRERELTKSKYDFHVEGRDDKTSDFDYRAMVQSNDDPILTKSLSYPLNSRSGSTNFSGLPFSNTFANFKLPRKLQSKQASGHTIIINPHASSTSNSFIMSPTASAASSESSTIVTATSSHYSPQFSELSRHIICSSTNANSAATSVLHTARDQSVSVLNGNATSSTTTPGSSPHASLPPSPVSNLLDAFAIPPIKTDFAHASDRGPQHITLIESHHSTYTATPPSKGHSNDAILLPYRPPLPTHPPPPYPPTPAGTAKVQDPLSPSSRISFAFCGELMLTNGHIEEEVGAEVSLSSISDLSLTNGHPNVTLASLHSHTPSTYSDFRVQSIVRPDFSGSESDPRSPVPVPLPLGVLPPSFDQLYEDERIAHNWHHEDSTADGLEGIPESRTTFINRDAAASTDEMKEYLLFNQPPVVFHPKAAYSNIRRRFNVFVRS